MSRFLGIPFFYSENNVRLGFLSNFEDNIYDDSFTIDRFFEERLLKYGNE